MFLLQTYNLPIPLSQIYVFNFIVIGQEDTTTAIIPTIPSFYTFITYTVTPFLSLKMSILPILGVFPHEECDLKLADGMFPHEERHLKFPDGVFLHEECDLKLADGVFPHEICDLNFNLGTLNYPQKNLLPKQIPLLLISLNVNH